MLAAAQQLAAGVSLRCPVCHRGRLYEQLPTLRMHRACSVCGWVFEREEGYWTGAVFINLAVAELVASAIAMGLVLLTSTPPLVIAAIGLPAVIVFPILFYPFARSFWLRLDLLLHPPEDGGET